MLQRYIGNCQFYKKVMHLTLPIMVQNGITNFVNMLDNVMVGQVGTPQMTGVAVANQLIFVFNLCVFGAVSGAGIFGAQYVGCGDDEGLRHTFRFKLLSSCILAALFIGALLLWGDELTVLYLRGEGSTADAAASLTAAHEYIRIMLIGMIPFAIVQCYSSTLRETGQTTLPMTAGVIAVVVNLALNYVLIFGHLGAPRMGVAGAAIATVISRFVELAIVAVWTHCHARTNPFIRGAFRSLRIPGSLVRQITVKGMPLLLNEAFWAAGMAMINQCYSVRGLDVMAASNIASTFFNLFAVGFQSVGAAIGIILGQLLGAGKNDEARDSCRKLIAFSIFVSAILMLLFGVTAIFIPELYNTTAGVRHIATRMMQISALLFPADAMAHCCYFTLRSGGKTWITILFDSCFVCCLQFPTAFVLAHCTSLPILPLYAVCQMVGIIKCVLGGWLVKKGVWIRNIVSATV